MEVTGKVTGCKTDSGISPRTGNPWKKAYIVVQYESGQYPKQVLLSNMYKAEDFAKIKIGDSGTFKFDGKVRESAGKYYQDLECWSWKIDSDMPI